MEEWEPPQRLSHGGPRESQGALASGRLPRKVKAQRSAMNFDPSAAQTTPTAPQAGPRGN